MATTRKTTRKPTKRSTETEKAPKPQPVKHSPTSLARRKAALVDELKDRPSAEREAEIRSELGSGDLASVPVLSHEELSRLGD